MGIFDKVGTAADLAGVAASVITGQPPTPPQQYGSVHQGRFGQEAIRQEVERPNPHPNIYIPEK